MTSIDDQKAELKVAIIHDWLIHMRGGEKVLEQLVLLYPNATIYTLFSNPSKLSPIFKNKTIKNSFLQSIPGIYKIYRWLLPILPLAIKSLKIEGDVDLVISSSHCVAKGIDIPAGAYHICYCHTPMRYLWGFSEEYFGNFPVILRPFIALIMARMKAFDLAANNGVNHFIANSHNVKDRIQKFYGHVADVVHPPANTDFYKPVKKTAQDYYLAVSAFVPYKKIDLIIKAFNALDRKLLIVGSGPMESKYKALRKSSKIMFLGSVSNEALRNLFSEAKALIFPTYEDFGIVPVEAQACGAPIIAFEKGGALESVKTGLFFKEQSSESLQKAILSFESETYDREETVRRVQSFSDIEFRKKIAHIIEEKTRLRDQRHDNP
jgi:glycosyltransferase involved in cell wall biosynthesis